MRLVALVALTALALPVHALAAKAKPPLCAEGIFAVAEAASPLVPGGPAIPDQLVLGEDGTLSVASGCPPVAAKQKPARKGNKLAARWTKKKGLCAALPKTARLEATFDTSCAALTGTFKSKGVKRRFTATRSLESFGAPSLARSLDLARHTTKRLGPAGGDVFARAADGTRFRLAVPPGALAEEVAITLTPVTSLGGLPLAGGLVGGADLAPSGLSFAIPATLYVMPAGGVPEALAAGFSWSGPADAFAVSPWWRDPKGRWLAMDVLHFSGYGIGIPGPSQLDALVAALLALGTAHAEVEGVLLACLEDPGEPCTEPDLELLLIEWYDTIVAPRLGAAAESGAPLSALTTPVAAVAAHQALRHWINALGSAFETPPDALASRWGQGLAEDFSNLRGQFLAYTNLFCTGAAVDWKDWVRIPEEIRVRAAQLHAENEEFDFAFDLDAGDYCARFRVLEVSFPPDLGPGTTELALSFETKLLLGVVGNATLQPTAARVFLSYSDGASGPAEVVTGADGTLDEPVLVQRAPGSPLVVRVDVDGEELELERPDVLSHSAVALAGALAFEANLDAAASPIVEPDATSEHCVNVGLAAAVGQLVQFTLDGAGTLSANSDALALDPVDEVLRACAEYTAPGGPVSKDELAKLRATLTYEGQTYEDELSIHPRWVEIALEADVGAGPEDATNAILWVPDAGPFAIEVKVTGPGATADDPPAAVPGTDLDADAQDALLVVAGSAGTGSLALVTNAVGKAGFALSGDEAETTHAVEVRHDPQGGSAPAGVVLKRLPPVMELSLPPTVMSGTPVPFELVATSGGEPAPGYHVELTATGGSVGAEQGVTNLDGEFQTTATLDSGQTLLTLSATLRAEPDGEVLDQQEVQSAAGELPRVLVTSREDRAFGEATVRGAVGPVSLVGNGATLSSDIELDEQGTVVRIEAHGSAEEGSPAPSAYFQVDLAVTGGAVQATFSTFAASAVAGNWLVLYAHTPPNVYTELRCLGDFCASPEGGGSESLAPGLYQIQGRAYRGGSFDLEVELEPAP